MSPRVNERITCRVCGERKNRRGFRDGACRRCNGTRKQEPRSSRPGVISASSPMTAALMLARVQPDPVELAAVEECVHRMRLPPDRGPRAVTRAGPEDAIDRVAPNRKRRIQLADLAIQMVREARS